MSVGRTATWVAALTAVKAAKVARDTAQAAYGAALDAARAVEDSERTTYEMVAAYRAAQERRKDKGEVAK